MTTADTEGPEDSDEKRPLFWFLVNILQILFFVAMITKRATFLFWVSWVSLAVLILFVFDTRYQRIKSRESEPRSEYEWS